MARSIVGEDFFEVYVQASFEACAQRDVKGLYAKAAKGEIANFTGRDSSFEAPEHPDLLLDTESTTVAEAAAALLDAVRSRISPAIPE
ncbi:MAG: adenylyl-sulfate kinase [Luteolibacter sp.]